MGILSGLEPKAVFGWFEELCALPRGSRHGGPVGDFLVAFARQRNLRHRRDEAGNVIIWKDAAPGYEDAPVVMLQSHTDMLLEKEHDCTRNLDEEGLELFVAGDEIGARGTTLGDGRRHRCGHDAGGAGRQLSAARALGVRVHRG